MKFPLPQGWVWARCHDVIDVRDGTHDTPNKVDSGIPMVTSKNLKPYGIDFEDITYISQEDYEAIERRSRVDDGDILFAMIGTIGNPVLVKKDRPFSIKNVALFKIDEIKVHVPFFKFMSCSTVITQQLDVNSRGGNQKFVSWSSLRKMQIPLPPLPEQKRIAAILNKADAIRRKRQQTVNLTEELLRSAFLDMFGDPVTNPKGWEVKPLAEEITFMTSGSRGWTEYYSDHGNKFIRIQNVKNGQLHFNDIQYVKAPDNKEAARTKVQENDLLISITADLGRTAVVDKQTADEGAHINQHLALVRLSNAINPHFVAAYLESQGGKRQFLQLDQAAVKSGLNFDSIKSLRIFNPPLVLQEQYATAVESVENTKVKLKGAADTSTTLFTSLLQRAFRGEL